MAAAYTSVTSSMSQAAAVCRPSLPPAYLQCSVLRSLPPRLASSSSISTSLKLKQRFSDCKKRRSIQIASSSSDESSGSVDVGEIVSDLKEKWDAIENKSTVITYGGGAIFAIWLSSVIVDSINSVPLIPKIMELVGLGYTGWFVYRYLLFKSSRKELANEIEDLKKKIAGND